MMNMCMSKGTGAQSVGAVLNMQGSSGNLPGAGQLALLLMMCSHAYQARIQTRETSICIMLV